MGEGHFSATDCHTVYRLFMNKLCVSLGHCCGPVTMASVVKGQGMWPYWATGMKREGGRRSGEGSLPWTTLVTGHISPSTAFVAFFFSLCSLGLSLSL